MLKTTYEESPGGLTVIVCVWYQKQQTSSSYPHLAETHMSGEFGEGNNLRDARENVLGIFWEIYGVEIFTGNVRGMFGGNF